MAPPEIRTVHVTEKEIEILTRPIRRRGNDGDWQTVTKRIKRGVNTTKRTLTIYPQDLAQIRIWLSRPDDGGYQDRWRAAVEAYERTAQCEGWERCPQ